MSSSKKPTEQSAITSPDKSVNSPEFRKSMLEELKESVKAGACKLASGNTIKWTPEELAAMTPEQRARVRPN